VTAIVWNTDNQLLLIRQNENNSWTLPGGIIDPGESPAQALVREVYEETGVKIRPKSIVGVFGGPEGFSRTYPNQDQVEFVDIVFECEAVGGTLECRDGEATEVRYFDITELCDLPVEYPVNLFSLINISSKPIFYWEESWLENIHN
jgi:ADP-ribose pyrophosphatase YjhB (NUDIX family)